MADGGPTSYDEAVMTTETRTTTTTTTTTSVDLSCDTNFIRSIQGILKIVEIVLSFISFIVILNPYRGASHNFFLFVSISCCIVSTCIFILLSTRIIYKITSVPWNLILAVIYMVMAMGYFIAFILVAANAYVPAHGSAATLGSLASVVYIFGMLFAVRDFRAASGQQSGTSNVAAPVVHETTETPPPAYISTSLYDPKY